MPQTPSATSHTSASPEPLPVHKPPPELHTFTKAQIRDFLSSPVALPEWKPPTKAFTATDRQRLDALHIPNIFTIHDESYPEFNLWYPDLNLYALGHLEDLDPDFLDRFDDFVSGDSHIALVNTSGSGKTRLLFETVHRRWGLYFNSCYERISNPLGSYDWTSGIDRLKADLRIYVPVPRQENDKEYLPYLQRNEAAVSLEIGALLLSRLIILDYFVDLITELDIDECEAITRWALLQLRPKNCLDHDAFNGMTSRLTGFPQADITRWVKTLAEKHAEKLSFVAFDEAQRLASLYDRAFLDSDRTAHRPLLRPLLISAGSYLPHSRIIISGTSVDPAAMEEYIAVSASSVNGVRPFVALGEFRSDARIRAYLTHFLGDSISDEDISIVTRWMRGRHRFLTVFVEYVLVHGPTQFLRVMDAIMLATTGFKRPGGKTKGIRVDLGHIMDAEELDTSPLARQLRCAMYSLLTRDGPASITDQAAAFVGSGAAHFTDSVEKAVIDEPLVCLSLVKWISRSPVYSTHGILYRRLMDPQSSITDCALPEGLALTLWSRHCASGVQLDEIAQFPGKTPSWAMKPAKFALTSADTSGRNHRTITTLDSPLVRRASDASDVMDWFQSADSPFLVPDAGLGAQLVFVLHTLTGPRVVFVHLEPFSTKRPHRVPEIVPTSPGQFYKADDMRRTELTTALASFDRDGPPAGQQRKKSFRTVQLYAFAKFSTSQRGFHPPAAILSVEDMLRGQTVKELGPQSVARAFR
ncbi:hypothetical protein EXIGLDRAFT_776717 [Exidia glandulosa HHB12029]|uniref:Uncharacterized protein n=1 Tax=Exidia glandulosa HHB12029 TaxID=1314781 RepID=A0A165DDI4_EXIGL|nr:hypothetical protein EXIGLDRAFT_776717 [Exidia glandulosa HHB12029]